MQRLPETELMDKKDHALVYSKADFEEPHSFIIQVFEKIFPLKEIHGRILDLGCGPGDISFRFARLYPQATVIGIDGAEVMIDLANKRKTLEKDLQDRVNFIQSYLPQDSIPPGPYDLITSNSLLHHLSDPMILWETVCNFCSPGTFIYMVDLSRPFNNESAQAIVKKYSDNEPDILKQDFYFSLLAAYEPHEVQSQIQKTNLSHLQVKTISDRHMVIFGRM